MSCPHISVYLAFRNQSGDGIYNHDFNCSASHERLGYLESLLAVIRLRYKKRIYIYPERLGIHGIESMLGINECGLAAFALHLGDYMKRNRRLTGRLRAEYLDNPSFGYSAYSEREIQ